MKSKRGGFTLIELLVVIAIIALLLSILLPGLGKAKDQAKKLVCQSHLKQWALATSAYSLENADKAPHFAGLGSTGAQDYWYYLLAPYLSASDYVQTGGEDGAMELMLCPMAKRISKDRGTVRVKGTARTDWYDGYTYSLSGVPASGSYGMNIWLDYEYVQRRSKTIGDLSENANGFPRISEASGRTPIFGDCNWVGGWPDDVDPVPEDIEVGGVYPDTDDVYFKQMGRFCIDRHNMKTNLCFVDGSAESVKLEDLWAQRWHKNFAPRTVEIQR